MHLETSYQLCNIGIGTRAITSAGFAKTLDLFVEENLVIPHLHGGSVSCSILRTRCNAHALWKQLRFGSARNLAGLDIVGCQAVSGLGHSLPRARCNC